MGTNWVPFTVTVYWTCNAKEGVGEVFTVAHRVPLTRLQNIAQQQTGGLGGLSPRR
jgi:hypothetical protein